jgi:hypothetical protein
MVINILYPAQIDNNTSIPDVIDNVTTLNADVMNRLKVAIIRTESALGVNPASIYTTVAARLDALETAIETAGGISLAGDLGGTLITPLVIGLQGTPISATLSSNVSTGYVLTWNGSMWNALPATGGSFTANGDLSGSNTSQTVKGLYNNPLASTTPVQSAVPVWDTGPAQYDIRKLTLDDLGPAFAIDSFSGGETVETGVTVTNPSFTVSYSSTPTSAQITNSDDIDSPLTLTSPYTSGTVTGSFIHSSSTSTYVTFDLTAVAATTQNAVQYLYYEIRDFAGVGTAGATSSVTASGNNAILSNSDTLASLGLFYDDTAEVGQTFGPFNFGGTSQVIYLLLQGNNHTFKDANTGFAFPFNTPTTVTFTNQHSVSGIAMYLYQSTNSFTDTSYSIEVIS